MSKLKRLQEKNLDILVKNEGFQFTETFFPYTSGKIGPYYVQSEVVMNNGKDYVSAISSITDLISNTVSLEEIDVISGGETRDWIFSGPVATALGKPYVMLYKNGKTVGASIAGMQVINVADLNNEGSSIRNYWAPIIKKAEGDISDVFFYVDRREDGVQVVSDLGLRSHAVVSLDEHAWDYLEKKNVVTKRTHANLQERMQDKESWASKMLRSEEGISTLNKLFMDSNTSTKGQKILEVGYPHLQEELSNRLQHSGVPKELLNVSYI